MSRLHYRPHITGLILQVLSIKWRLSPDVVYTEMVPGACWQQWSLVGQCKWTLDNGVWVIARLVPSILKYKRSEEIFTILSEYERSGASIINIIRRSAFPEGFWTRLLNATLLSIDCAYASFVINPLWIISMIFRTKTEPKNCSCT